MDAIKIRYALRDELINIYMMTEGMSVYPKYAQVFLCKRNALPNTQKDSYYLLDAKKSSPIYEMTSFGQRVLERINVPNLKYIAKVDYQLKIVIYKEVFEDLNPYYFPIWTPESPYNYFTGQSIGYLVVFRVYEIENPINDILLEKGRRGRNSVFGLYDSDGNAVEFPVGLKEAVLAEDEFLVIKQDIIHKLSKARALIGIL